jgi:glycosyltransferase involved in cell wall biosynthesis
LTSNPDRGAPPAYRFVVVLQTPRDEHSAVFITYQSVADELRARGHAVTIITPSDFPALTRPGGRWTPILYPLVMGRWLRRHRGCVDVAVFHSYAGWWTAASGGTRGLTNVVAFHGLEPAYHRELLEESRAAGGLSWRYRLLQERFMPAALRTACRHASLVTCLNAAERDEITRRGWAPAARVATVAHGVPGSFFAVQRPVRAARTLLFVGQWLPMKGTTYLAAAFNELAGRHPGLHLVCAGTLAAADVVRRSFDQAVRARVTVLPRVDRGTLLQCHAEADIFVFPSVYEGFGVAVLEAMASGLPIVTTPVGVAADALRADVNALTVPKRDAKALVRSIERLMADTDLRGRLGASARARALDYREQDRVRDVAELLVRVAESAPAGVPDPLPSS